MLHVRKEGDHLMYPGKYPKFPSHHQVIIQCGLPSIFVTQSLRINHLSDTKYSQICRRFLSPSQWFVPSRSLTHYLCNLFLSHLMGVIQNIRPSHEAQEIFNVDSSGIAVPPDLIHITLREYDTHLSEEVSLCIPQKK